MRQIYRVCLFSMKALSVLKWSVVIENDLRREKASFWKRHNLVQGGDSKKLFGDATYADIALLDISRVIVLFLDPLIITWSSKIYP